MFQASFRILVLQYFAFGVKNVIFLHVANKMNILSNDEREILHESIAYFWYLLNARQQWVKYIKRFRKAQNKPLFNTDGIHLFSEKLIRFVIKFILTLHVYIYVAFTSGDVTWTWTTCKKKIIDIGFDFNFTKLCFGETDVSSCFIWFCKSRSEPVAMTQGGCKRWFKKRVNRSCALLNHVCCFIFNLNKIYFENRNTFQLYYKLYNTLVHSNAKTNLIIVTGCTEFSNDLMQHTILMNS